MISLFYSSFSLMRSGRAGPSFLMSERKQRTPKGESFLLRCPALSAAGKPPCQSPTAAPTIFSLPPPPAAVENVAFGTPLGLSAFKARLDLISAPQQAAGEAAGGYFHHPVSLFRRAALQLARRWQAGLSWAVWTLHQKGAQSPNCVHTPGGHI